MHGIETLMQIVVLSFALVALVSAAIFQNRPFALAGAMLFSAWLLIAMFFLTSPVGVVTSFLYATISVPFLAFYLCLPFLVGRFLGKIIRGRLGWHA